MPTQQTLWTSSIWKTIYLVYDGETLGETVVPKSLQDSLDMTVSKNVEDLKK